MIAAPLEFRASPAAPGDLDTGDGSVVAEVEADRQGSRMNDACDVWVALSPNTYRG